MKTEIVILVVFEELFIDCKGLCLFFLLVIGSKKSLDVSE